MMRIENCPIGDIGRTCLNEDLIEQMLIALKAMHTEFGESFPDNERTAVDLARRAIAKAEGG